MSELKLFLLARVLTQLQHHGPCIISRKKSKSSHSNHSGHIDIEGDIMQNHEQKKSKKKCNFQDSMGKRNLFLSTLPFNPWAVSTTWLHVGALQKIHENTCFEQNFTTGSYGVGIGCAWCFQKACRICSSLVQKKKLKKNYFSSHKLPKQ
jgi:hypothetical protein